jgi:HK97 family phage prohead protease
MIDTTLSAPETAREVKFCALDVKSIGLDGRFEGYASLFNRQDLGGDTVLPGAFRETLAERGSSGVRMLFQHDPAQPIGAWEHLREDARGLFARGRLTTEVAKAREVLALMRSGAIDGLSIGFKTLLSRPGRGKARRLAKIDLWEISIVTFPMLPEARISAVKAAPFAGRRPSEREFERWLTQDAGFTRSEARALIRDGLKGFSAQRDAGGPSNWERRILAQMREATRLLNSFT